METLKFFNRFFAFSIVLIAIGFSSCSKDDEPAGEEPAKDGGGRRLVSKMEWVSEDDDDEFTVRFFYNKDGSLNKLTSDEDDLEEMTFTRVGDKLIIKGDYTDGVETLTGTLNGDGYVILYDYEDEDRYTYEYRNGFISNAHMAGLNWTVTWQNGDLLKTEPETVLGRIVHNTSYTYTDRENKMNVEVLDFTYPTIFEDCEYGMTSGYFGKRNTHLLKKAEEIWDSGDGGNSDEFSYEFDSEGYVTKILQVSKEWGQGSKKSTWTYTITVSYVE